MEIGDRIFHRGLNGNGIVASRRDSERYRDHVGVSFWNPTHIERELHTLDGELREEAGLWCSENQLVQSPLPETYGRRVSILGNRGTHKRMRRVAELPRRLPRDRSDIIVNYGYPHHKVSRRLFVLNREIHSNKYRQCMLFRDYDVPVPDTSRRRQSGYIQKPFYSFGGRNIFEGRNIRPSLGGYYQRKVDKLREFRAHVFLWGDEKVPLIQEKTVSDRTQLCWNKHQGGVFNVAYCPLLEINELGRLADQIREISVRAVRAIQHDFGGADILLDENGDLWVIEVNSRCGAKERTLAVYKTKLWELFGLNIRRYKEERWNLR